METRNAYPTDVSDAEWAFVAPYLTLMTEDAPQRVYFPARRLQRPALACPRRRPLAPPAARPAPPGPPSSNKLSAGCAPACSKRIVHDLRALLRVAAGRAAEPSAAIFDGRTLQSTPESGARAGYDGAKRRKGSKVHMAVDTLGHLLAVLVTAGQ